MRSLRYAIIALGLLSLILLFAMPLAHSARGSAEAVRGGPSLPSVLLLVYAIGTVLLLVMGVVYASKSRLSPSWILGSILLPGLVPLIMALRHLPRLREESSRPVRTISRGASSPPVAAPAPDATRTVEEPISALPLCAWTPGLDGAAPGAGSWKAAVDAFIGNEVMKAAPQFPAFRSAIARFPAPERHAAWHHVGFAFKGRGDVGTANLCFVEGLRADPDPCSANWGAIGLLRGRSWIEPFPDRPTPRLEEKARSAVVALARGLRLDELMTHTPIEDYNAAVRFLNCKVYDEAIALFDRHIDDEALGLMAFYAGGLCRLAAGERWRFRSDSPKRRTRPASTTSQGISSRASWARGIALRSRAGAPRAWPRPWWTEPSTRLPSIRSAVRSRPWHGGSRMRATCRSAILPPSPTRQTPTG